MGWNHPTIPIFFAMALSALVLTTSAAMADKGFLGIGDDRPGIFGIGDDRPGILGIGDDRPGAFGIGEHPRRYHSHRRAWRDERVWRHTHSREWLKTREGRRHYRRYHLHR